MIEIEFRKSSDRIIVDMPVVPRVDEFVNVCNSSGQRISGRVQQVQYLVDSVGDPCEILVFLGG